ncbi:dTDP-4-dehydrorhamnose 3,5-epimerase [Cesiribacter sp. SM1]|uniref:dTDP-4-dehydrorhamnose 3,5-epimerase n=1 Tax=Cesiribacter sp. SM1 TaxID=2861196 RepID=UPI001CD2D225|nr:dTDP-4-dehydrorhamnose 3,5-epimerase [Cesiribacter sp. SM1]
MRAVLTPIEGLVEIYPKVLFDDRGFFFESFHQKKLKELGVKDLFVQDNQSFSKKGVLRGIHFQNGASQQSKLIRVIKGKVLDVAVDLRPNSPTFGKYHSTILDDQEHKQFYMPEGFGHGFLALEDTILLYKCNDYYDPSAEGGIIWNDPTLNINWGAESPTISEKDLKLPTFKEFTDQLAR